MQEKIKQLYTQSVRDGENALAIIHSELFDIEAFAQRIVFRCATAAKVAQAEGKDAYSEIMSKFGAETEYPSELGGHKLHPLGTEIPELTANDTISQDLNEALTSRFGKVPCENS